MERFRVEVRKPKVYKCLFCSYVTNFAQDLVNHLLIVEKLPPSHVKEIMEKRAGSPKEFPIETYPEKERERIIGWIEAEGSFFVRLVRGHLIEDYTLPVEERNYKYNYIRPAFSFGMEEKTLVKVVQKALNLRYFEYLQPPPRGLVYYAHSTTVEQVVKIAEWLKPHLTPDTRMHKQAVALLTIFKEKPSIKITKEQARTILPIKREERWENLLEWKKRREI